MFSPWGVHKVSHLKRFWLLACLVSPCFAPLAAAAETCACAHCGVHSHCRAVCRCVPSTEEKKEVCFECRCEDFCIPGPSIWCGRKCEAMPLPENQCGCPQNCCISWNVWKPRCAEVRTKRVLVIHEVKKEVPSFKWEVEYLCDECQRCCAEAAPATVDASEEILPVSAETPIETDPVDASADLPPVKQSWISRLLGD